MKIAAGRSMCELSGPFVTINATTVKQLMDVYQRPHTYHSMHAVRVTEKHSMIIAVTS